MRPERERARLSAWLGGNSGRLTREHAAAVDSQELLIRQAIRIHRRHSTHGGQRTLLQWGVAQRRLPSASKTCGDVERTVRLRCQGRRVRAQPRAKTSALPTRGVSPVSHEQRRARMGTALPPRRRAQRTAELGNCRAYFVNRSGLCEGGWRR